MSSTLKVHKVSRRQALAVFGASFGAVVLAACGASQTPQAPAISTPGTTSAPPAGLSAGSATSGPSSSATTLVSSSAKPSTGTPKVGGKLRFAMATDLDQGVEAARLGNAYTPSVFMMFDTLTAYDAQRQPQPLLAESWDWSTDNTTLKLNLRKGVTFHSGR